MVKKLVCKIPVTTNSMRSVKMKTREIILIDLTYVLLDFPYFNLMFLRKNLGLFELFCN